MSESMPGSLSEGQSSPSPVIIFSVHRKAGSGPIMSFCAEKVGEKPLGQIDLSAPPLPVISNFEPSSSGRSVPVQWKRPAFGVSLRSQFDPVSQPYMRKGIDNLKNGPKLCYICPNCFKIVGFRVK